MSERTGRDEQQQDRLRARHLAVIVAVLLLAAVTVFVAQRYGAGMVNS
ncbi:MULTISPECIES: hypothetical protein [Actinoplanes]|nr:MULTISPECIES: hypothetical protein [Actinoplanes]GLY01139.1 hypothetical protein Acsp01_15180 [Actinoplanes sp. NBRC 101535]